MKTHQVSLAAKCIAAGSKIISGALVGSVVFPHLGMVACAAVSGNPMAGLIYHLSFSELKQLKEHIQTAQRELDVAKEVVARIEAKGGGTDDILSESHHIFNPVVDENKFAETAYLLYDKQEKADCDKMQFAAYLFILVVKEKFGKTNFEEQGKSQFYKFIQAKVFTDLEQDRRTFSNRLNKLDYLLEKETNVEVRLKKNPDWKNFQKLQEDFHKTSFFDSLKDLSAGKDA